MPKNIWIRIAILLFGYMRASIQSCISIARHSVLPKSPKDYQIAHDIISVGPDSLAHTPRAIRIGRALFVPLLLISQLYDRKTHK